MNKRRWVNSVLVLLGIFSQIPAYAALGDSFSFTFKNITNPAVAANVIDGEANLALLLTDNGANNVSFKFTNNSNFSSITDVYFDSGPLASFSSITSSPGVSFSSVAAPPNLPGGNSVTPPFDGSAFSADSNPPVSANGVQNSDVTGEQLTVAFNLQPGKTWNALLTSMALPGFPIETPANSWLRVGIHVQSFQNGSSSSFINTPLVLVSPVPEPGAYALMLAGLALVSTIARKRSS
jgi:hypothetical protein